MISNRMLTALFLVSLSSYACADAPADPAASTSDAVQRHAPAKENDKKKDDDRTGPGAVATDNRVPELGGDPTIVKQSKITMAAALALVEKDHGPAIEAKFELNDEKKLNLSIYPVGKGITTDATNNVFQEVQGNPTVAPWATEFSDFEKSDFVHTTESSRDLTLVQLSRLSLSQAVARASKEGFVYWAIPTIEKGRAGYGVYTLDGAKSEYEFIDGQGSARRTVDNLVDLGTGPGAGATDTRRPEIPDLSVLATSKITIAQALKQVEAKHGPMIEAKFEMNDAGHLSLSIYPVGKGIKTAPMDNEFQELSGEVAKAPWDPEFIVFEQSDFEHVTESTRDLTIIQTASLTLAQAVDAVDAAVPGGFVYWAIPTIRDTRSGYGIYVMCPDHKAHYFFVS